MLWKPTRAIHCNYTYSKFQFYTRNFHSTMEISVVRIEISILPTLLLFHFSNLLASSDLQTFILPFSISLSSACTSTTTTKAMALHTKPRDYIAFSPSLGAYTCIWWSEHGDLHISLCDFQYPKNSRCDCFTCRLSHLLFSVCIKIMYAVFCMYKNNLALTDFQYPTYMFMEYRKQQV